MPIDPNIPLQAGQPSGPFGPDLSKLLIMQSLAQKTQMLRQQQNEQNALGKVFSNPDATDPKTGYPTPEGLNMIGRVAPTYYMDVLGKVAAGQERQMRDKVIESGLYDKFKKQAYEGAVEAVGAYDSNLKYGQEAATRAYRQKLAENHENMKKSGFSEWLAPTPLFPDIAQARSAILGYRAANAKPMTEAEQANLGIKNEELGIKKTELSMKAGEFTTHTDYGKTPPVEYRLYKDGSTTSISGEPYTPTGVGEPKGADATPVIGEEVDDKGNKKEVQVRMGPSGWTEVGTNRPVPNVTELRRIGTKAEEGEAVKGESSYEVQGPDGKITQKFLQRGAKAGEYYENGKKLDPEQYKVVDKLSPAQSSTPEEAESQARQIGEMKVPVTPYMWARTSPEVKRIVERDYPQWSAAKSVAAAQLREGYAKTSPGSPGGQIGSINTAVQHVQVFDDLAKALKNKDPRAMNYVINYARYQMGRPEVTNFNTAAQVVADEVVKAVTGAGGVYDRAELQRAMSSNNAPEQLKQQAINIKRLMAGRLATLEKQWTSKDLPDEDFKQMLLPATSEALEGLIPERDRASAEGRASVERHKSAAGDTSAMPPSGPSERVLPDGRRIRYTGKGNPDTDNDPSHFEIIPAGR